MSIESAPRHWWGDPEVPGRVVFSLVGVGHWGEKRRKWVGTRLGPMEGGTIPDCLVKKWGVWKV